MSTSGTVTQVNTAPRRRYDQGISQALFHAAARVMETEGFSGLTIDGLVTEVGTSRPAFYRRYSSIAQLALDVILDRFADAPSADTGSLRSDLLQLQRNDVAMMTSPLIQHSLPALFDSMRTDDRIRTLYMDRLISPRRNNVANVIEAAQARGEVLKEKVDTEYVCDLLFGPLLCRVLLPTGLSLNDSIARDTVETVMRELLAVE